MSSSEPRIAIYPGSFDPLTLGHEDIARRSLRLADQVVVAVAHTNSQSKPGLFSVEERLEMLKEAFGDEDRIECTSFKGLLVDFARARGAGMIVRGLRAVSDFEYEFQMALMNRDLEPEVETLFLAPDARYSYLSASLVREIASLGGDISAFVAPVVQQRLLELLDRK
jgi:pantetheine-phosphate adenylyltransferase